MKVLLCCPFYSPHIRGGGEISTQLLAHGLQDAGVDVEVLTTFRSDVDENIDGIQVHRVKSPNIYWSFDSKKKPIWQKLLWHINEGYNWRKVASFEKVINEFQPDLLHTSSIEDLSPGIWRLAADKGIPVVHTLRSYTLLCINGGLFRKGRNCESLCAPCRVVSAPKRVSSEAVAAVIGISKFILHRHLQLGFFPKAQHFVVSNIAEKTPEMTGHETPGGRKNPQEGRLSIGFLGRLSPEKGVERIFQALLRMNPETRPLLWIGGWGDSVYEAHLRDASAGLDVRFMGRIEPNELFAQIDLLVVPSRWNEPLGRIVLEAFSRGLPVLGAKRGGIPEMISPGVNGLLFDPDDPHELETILSELTDDPVRISCMASALLNWGDENSSESIVNKHMEIYRGLLNEQRESGALDGALKI